MLPEGCPAVCSPGSPPGAVVPKEGLGGRNELGRWRLAAWRPTQAAIVWPSPGRPPSVCASNRQALRVSVSLFHGVDLVLTLLPQVTVTSGACSHVTGVNYFNTRVAFY